MNGRMLKALCGLCLLAALLPAQAQEVFYIHTDALGSPVAETDANRNVVARFEYEPYGRRLNGGNDDKPGYTGHVMDAATGLVYAQQRYYWAEGGIFLSVDPVTAFSSPVGQFHRYRYAANNPYRFTDPDGRLIRDRDDPSGWRDNPLSPQLGPDVQLGEKKSKEEARTKKNADDGPAGEILSASSVGAAGSGIAADKAANGLARFGWRAGEEAAEWKGISRSFARLGAGLGLAQSGSNIYTGVADGDWSKAGHGVATGAFTLATYSSPWIAIGGTVIDAGVQQVAYYPANGGAPIVGWSAFPAMARDYFNRDPEE